MKIIFIFLIFLCSHFSIAKDADKNNPYNMFQNFQECLSKSSIDRKKCFAEKIDKIKKNAAKLRSVTLNFDTEIKYTNVMVNKIVANKKNEYIILFGAGAGDKTIEFNPLLEFKLSLFPGEYELINEFVSENLSKFEVLEDREDQIFDFEIKK